MDYNEPTILTVCYPMTDTEILLGKKKKKPNASHYVYGVGLYNGFGGHNRTNETVPETAGRELTEESGLIAIELTKIGVVLVVYKDKQLITELHFFTTTSFRGEVRETEEMRPIWCRKNRIPLDDMWPNDAYYMEMILNGQPFIGYFLLDNPDDKNILSHIVEQVDILPDHLDHIKFLKSIE